MWGRGQRQCTMLSGKAPGSQRKLSVFPFHTCGKGVFPPYLMLFWLRPSTLLFDTSLSGHTSNLSENPIFLRLCILMHIVFFLV